MRTTYYFIQIKEDGVGKNIPHTKGTKNCEFLSRKTANVFMDKLIEKNPTEEFRLVKRVETYTEEKWKKKS